MSVQAGTINLDARHIYIIFHHKMSSGTHPRKVTLGDQCEAVRRCVREGRIFEESRDITAANHKIDRAIVQLVGGEVGGHVVSQPLVLGSAEVDELERLIDALALSYHQ
ncbi:hypothetical protein HPB48_021824 [Haemaphysalis longicornis]|uniref:Uncharacterized protein n=1 Tax=Haemaphysalis longicornis TaxID=44386 RepID=A0A9J6FUU7_HAELO|nr:hypothetical protein HPB48_021824 [Haemaphysalis longicornis]